MGVHACPTVVRSTQVGHLRTDRPGDPWQIGNSRRRRLDPRNPRTKRGGHGNGIGHGCDFLSTHAARSDVRLVVDGAPHCGCKVGGGERLGSESDCCTGALAHGGVLVVVGALWKHHLRYAVSQRAEDSQLAALPMTLCSCDNCRRVWRTLHRSRKVNVDYAVPRAGPEGPALGVVAATAAS